VEEPESEEFAFNWLQGLGLWDIAYPELSVVKIENVLISIFYISENPICIVFQFFSLNKRVHTENEMVVIVENLGIGTPLCTCAFSNHKNNARQRYNSKANHITCHFWHYYSSFNNATSGRLNQHS